MLGDIEEVAVRVRAAGLGVEAAKVCYLFMLRERELSNHRATFKTIPGWSDGLNDWNGLKYLQSAEKLCRSPSTVLGARPELDEGTTGGGLISLRLSRSC